jgi:hypothetical protein
MSGSKRDRENMIPVSFVFYRSFFIVISYQFSAVSADVPLVEVLSDALLSEELLFF